MRLSGWCGCCARRLRSQGPAARPSHPQVQGCAVWRRNAGEGRQRRPGDRLGRSTTSRLLKKAHLPRWRARAALRRTRKYVSHLHPSSGWVPGAPPCIWTFLSSLGENGFFSILLNPHPHILPGSNPLVLAAAGHVHGLPETRQLCGRGAQAAGSVLICLRGLRCSRDIGNWLGGRLLNVSGWRLVL